MYLPDYATQRVLRWLLEGGDAIGQESENDKETYDALRCGNGGDGRVGYGRKICGVGRLV